MVEKKKVIATEDFFVGPHRKKVVSKGEVFEVNVLDNSVFVIKRDDGSAFGACYIGHGFELLEEDVVKDLAYFKKNAEEDYMKVPISVLRYIGELERAVEEMKEESYHSGIERDLGD